MKIQLPPGSADATPEKVGDPFIPSLTTSLPLGEGGTSASCSALVDTNPMDESEDWFVLLLSRGDQGPALHLSLTNGHAERQGGLPIGVWLEEGYYGKKVSVPRGHPLSLDRGSGLFLGCARFQGVHGCRLQASLALWDM